MRFRPLPVGLFLVLASFAGCGGIVERGGRGAAGAGSGSGATGGGSIGTGGIAASGGGAVGYGGGPIGTGGAEGGPIGTGGVGGAPSAAKLGATCTTDADCGPGLLCLQPSGNALGVGGPSRGYCTAQCSQPADCAAISPSARCVAFGAKSFCLEGCDPSCSNECHGRYERVVRARVADFAGWRHRRRRRVGRHLQTVVCDRQRLRRAQVRSRHGPVYRHAERRRCDRRAVQSAGAGGPLRGLLRRLRSQRSDCSAKGLVCRGWASLGSQNPSQLVATFHKQGVCASSAVGDGGVTTGVLCIGSCSGTASPCNTLGAVDCAAADGCTQTAPACTGAPYDCIVQPTAVSCTVIGCSWDDTNQTCSGTPTPCDAYPKASSCTAAGCAFSPAACTGTATACGSLTTHGSCTAQPGCVWQ